MKLFRTIIFLYIVFVINLSFLNAKINIIIDIDGEIITNHDLDKEIKYLEILNQNLRSLNDKQKKMIAIKSLTEEKIKKREVDNFLKEDLNELTINQYLDDIYLKLDIKNEIEFKNLLKKNQTYSIDQVKEKIKIDFKWNRLVYIKYINSIKIDKDKFIAKIDKINSNYTKDFLLSEIVFTQQEKKLLKDTIDQIRQSIDEIGFNNTATIYSNSDSAKVGGKLEWLNENNLSQKILNEIINTKEGEMTDLIKLGNFYLIIKVEKIRVKKNEIDKEKELEKMIQIETNRQLNKFSNIYFKKARQNIYINEK